MMVQVRNQQGVICRHFTFNAASICPKGEQIPMYALIFRGYEVDGKILLSRETKSQRSFRRV